MNLSELQSAVYDLTGRPDLEARTRVAIQAATLKVHHMDFFSRDLVEDPIDLGVTAFVHNFDYKSVYPRWRAIKYLRYLDTTISPPAPGDFFKVLEPEQLLDSYGATKTDVCYLAGIYIQINAKAELRYCLMGSYLHPNIEESSYSSWIADEHPFAIAYEAARTICKLVGLDQQYTRMKDQVEEEFTAVRITGLSPRGY